MKVIIAGGGVGGLVTALMLHARGIDCEIFEQADAIRELGVGINTLPHAIKELAELGLLERLDALAIRTEPMPSLPSAIKKATIWRRHGYDDVAKAPAFSARLSILPTLVRGRASTMAICFGHLYLTRFSLQ